jgi:catechol 2,3-dioxygenase-like lactoylglutathione lyase family enzyme
MAIQRLDHVNFITHDMLATIDFYCDVIGLESGKHLSIDTAQSVYLYIPGQQIAILHIGHANHAKSQPKFERFADLDENNGGQFSTGSFDHFCLALDDDDYVVYIEKFEKKGVAYQTYCHDDFPLKQIWVLDPNGIRVELNFI